MFSVNNESLSTSSGADDPPAIVFEARNESAVDIIGNLVCGVNIASSSSLCCGKQNGGQFGRIVVNMNSI